MNPRRGRHFGRRRGAAALPLLGAGKVLLGTLLLTISATIAACDSTNSKPTATAVPQASSAVRHDFMFQIIRHHTENQGGQTLNIYVHYRYQANLDQSKFPNYEDLRTSVLNDIDHIDTRANPYWEVVNAAMCGKLKSGYPLDAISCQMQAYPDRRPGLPYEPGFHSSIETIGDIEPLTIPGDPYLVTANEHP